MANPVEDGWITHDGGECPVASDVNVEIRLVHRDGDLWERDGYEVAGWFDGLGWWDDPSRFNRIVAYRIVEQGK